MKVSDYYPEEKAVGPNKKFMMFFTDNKAPWAGGNVEFGLEFNGRITQFGVITVGLLL